MEQAKKRYPSLAFSEETIKAFGLNSALADQHLSDEYFKFDPNKPPHPEDLIRKFLHGPEQLRFLQIRKMYIKILQLTPNFPVLTQKKLYNLSYHIFYHILFNIFKGVILDTAIPLLGAISVYFAIKALNDAFVTQNMSIDYLDNLLINLGKEVGYRYNEMMRFCNTIEWADKAYFDKLEKYFAENIGLADILGRGTYGVVVGKPLSNKSPNGRNIEHSSDKYVSKIMTDQEAYKKTIKMYRMIAEIVEDQSDFEAYEQSERLMKDLPKYLYQALYILYKGEITPNQPVYSVRMPRLGVSIGDMVATRAELEACLSCDFHLIMAQLLKCHSQLAHLAKKKYVHGDLRPANMMWNKSTCSFHIIDFDMLETYDDFDKTYRKYYGFDSNPPEVMMLTNLESLLEIQMNNWAENNYNMYHYLFETYPSRDTKEKFLDAVKEANKSNLAYYINIAKIFQKQGLDAREAMFQAAKEISYPSFDSFSYALTMSLVFYFVYPHSMDKIQAINNDEYNENESGIPKYKARYKATLIKSIKPHLQNKYDDAYYNLIADTLMKINMMFLNMRDLQVDARLNAEDSFKLMEKIYDEFVKEHNKLLPNKAISRRGVEAGAKKEIETVVKIAEIGDEKAAEAAASVIQSASNQSAEEVAKAAAEAAVAVIESSKEAVEKAAAANNIGAKMSSLSLASKGGKWKVYTKKNRNRGRKTRHRRKN